MKLIFAGDLLAPERLEIKNEHEFYRIFEDGVSIANLEGPVLTTPESSCIDKYKYNLSTTAKSLPFFRGINLKYVSFANNHIADFIGGIDQTKEFLESNDIRFFGEKDKPFEEIPGNNSIILIGVKTVVTGGNQQDGKSSVAQFRPGKTLQAVKSLKAHYPNTKIVVFIHWGYELAEYPQPADRNLARTLIDHGVDLVVGHHPHVIQGVERYKHKYIFYSLGNFCLPQDVFHDKKLQYRTHRVRSEILLECDPDLSGYKLHWLDYDKENAALSYIRTSGVEDSAILSVTPFSNLSDSEYVTFFKKNQGAKMGKVKYPTFISYFGVWRLHSIIMQNYFLLLQLVRKLAIKYNLHKPYNW